MTPGLFGRVRIFSTHSRRALARRLNRSRCPKAFGQSLLFDRTAPNESPTQSTGDTGDNGPGHSPRHNLPCRRFVYSVGPRTRVTGGVERRHGRTDHAKRIPLPQSCSVARSVPSAIWPEPCAAGRARQTGGVALRTHSEFCWRLGCVLRAHSNRFGMLRCNLQWRQRKYRAGGWPEMASSVTDEPPSRLIQPYG